jgi:hypothetical protein
MTRARVDIGVFFQLAKAALQLATASSSSAGVPWGTRATNSWVAGFSTSVNVVEVEVRSLPSISSFVTGAEEEEEEDDEEEEDEKGRLVTAKRGGGAKGHEGPVRSAQGEEERLKKGIDEENPPGVEEEAWRREESAGAAAATAAAAPPPLVSAAALRNVENILVRACAGCSKLPSFHSVSWI